MNETVTTTTWAIAPETKQAMLNLCRRTKVNNVELGMILPVVNNEVIAGPTKWGSPNYLMLDPLETPFGAFHTHPGEKAPELSDPDMMCLLLNDPCLFIGVGNPNHNFARVAAKRKPVGSELKKSWVPLYIEWLTLPRSTLSKPGGPIEGIGQYFRDYTIYLDDARTSYIKTVIPAAGCREIKAGV